jgi:uncharacterized RDD family membrane protein YckC
VQDFHLDTPEAIDLAYDVAGIGSRFLAATLDLLVVIALLILIAVGAVAVGQFGDAGATLATVLFTTLTFVLIWGYYVVFETVWRGQTPGKRALEIRVLKTSGQPIGFVDALIRNIVRVVDFLPVAYGIGVLSMFISSESRRLGDYAAGTIVVKEREKVALRDLMASRVAVLPGAEQPPIGESDPEELAWNLRALTPHDVHVVTELLTRAPSIPPQVRDRIASEVAPIVAERIGAREPFDSIRFLRRVLYLHGLSG